MATIKKEPNSSEFFCNFCEKSFNKKIKLEIHSRIHTGEKPYVCSTCSARFAFRINLRKHIDTFGHAANFILPKDLAVKDDGTETETDSKADVNKFSCNYCDKSYPRKAFLSNHLKIHKIKKEKLGGQTNENGTAAKEKIHFCKVCGKSFRFKRNLARHEVVHTNSQQNVERNIKTEQNNVEIRQTRQASFQTDSDETKNTPNIKTNENAQDPKLLNPQNDPDNSMRLILCAICNKTFKLRIQLKRHMMQVHNKPSDSPMSQIENPVLVESSPAIQNLFKCPRCDRSFPLKRNLYRHLTTSHGESYKKTTTGPGLTISYSVKSDARVKKGKWKIRINKNPNKSYTCDVCNVVIVGGKAFRRHCKIHISTDQVETQSESHPIMPSTNKEITEENLETKEIFENREQEKIINEYSGHNFDCFVSIKNISLRPFLNWVVRREEHLASGLPAREFKEFDPPSEMKKSDTPTNNGVVTDFETNDNSEIIQMKEIESIQHFRSDTLDTTEITKIHPVNTNKEEINKKEYSCKVCKKIFFLLPDLLSHEKQHSAEKTYTCNICLMVFKYPAMILHHVKTVHNIRPFKCDHCSLSFNKRGLLKTHIIKEHNILKPKLKSVLLNYQTGSVDSTKPYEAKEMSTTEHLVNRNPYKCAKCSQSFRKRKFFNHHVKNCGLSNQHESITVPNESPIQENNDDSITNIMSNDNTVKQDFIVFENMNMNCFVNIDKIKIKSVSQDHNIDIQNVISGTADTEENSIVYDDDLNDDSFDNVENVESFDSNIEEYKCSNCPMIFKQFSDLFIHLKNVHKLKPYSCPMCTLRFNRKKNLDKHIELDHEEGVKTEKNNQELSPTSLKLNKRNLYKCTLCIGSFSQSTFLELHMKSHSEAEKNALSSKDGPNQTSENELPIERIVQENGKEQKIPFKCDICSKSFTHMRSCTKHMRIHTRPKPFKCPHCPHRAFSSDWIPIHIREVHNIDPFQCLKCDKGHDQKMDLLIHLKAIHSENYPVTMSIDDMFRDQTLDNSYQSAGNETRHDEKNMIAVNEISSVAKYECRICYKKFATNQQLENHSNIHTGHKPYKCPKCPYRTVNSNNVLSHLRRKHSVKPFKCSTCYAEFDFKEDLLDHLQVQHGIENPFVKSVAKSFMDPTYRRDMNMPIKEKATNEDYKDNSKYWCHVCNKNFQSRAALENHMRVHTGEKPFKCTHCDFRGSLSINILQHLLQQHNVKPFKCSECDAGFKSNRALKDHLIEIHNVKKPKVKSYDDMFRDKSYNSKQQFKEVSKQLQNYKCSNCPRTFNDLENLLPHLKNDHNVKLVHKCPKCSDSFNLKASLIDHLKMVHNVEHPIVSKGTFDKIFKNDNAPSTQMNNGAENGSYKTNVVEVAHEYENQFIERVNRRPSKHQCHICNKVLASSAHFKIHLRVHTGERPYQCTKCPNSYTYTQQLLDHLVQDHGDRPFACDKCEKKFYFRNTLIDHLKMDHQDENPKLETVSDMLLRGTDSGKEMAAQSNNTPSRMTSVDRHESYPDEIIIDDTPMFTESNTYSIFNDQKVENAPVESNSQFLSEYQCNICYKSFGSTHYLEIHKRIHTNEKPYKCGRCSLAFHQSSAFLIHIRKVHKIKPFICEVCGRKFNLRRNLVAHLKTDHQKFDFKIKTVDDMFKWKEDSLNQFTGITMPSNDDLAINTNRESFNQVTIPNMYYSCKFCPLKFNTKAQMNFHLKKRHSTIRPTNLFTIEETPVSSSSQDTLINKCPYCPKTCKLKIALVNHIKQKHMATMSRNIKMYRPRGRPRKNLHDQNGSGFHIQQSATTKSQNGAQAGNTQLKGKRGRGRPRNSDYVMNPDGTRTIILKKVHSQNIEGVNEVEEFHRIDLPDDESYPLYDGWDNNDEAYNNDNDGDDQERDVLAVDWESVVLDESSDEEAKRSMDSVSIQEFANCNENQIENISSQFHHVEIPQTHIKEENSTGDNQDLNNVEKSNHQINQVVIKRELNMSSMMRFVNETEEENDNEVTNAATNDTTGIDLDYEHLN